VTLEAFAMTLPSPARVPDLTAWIVGYRVGFYGPYASPAAGFDGGSYFAGMLAGREDRVRSLEERDRIPAHPAL
jgi:hypothetical protein